MRRLSLAIVWFTAATAAAQALPAAPAIDLETLYLDPAGKGSLTVGSGETLKGGQFRVGAALSYTYGQLQFSTATTEGEIVLRDRVGLQVFGAVGITDWLEVGATLPFILQQWFNENPFATTSAGLGTPLIHVKFGLLNEKRPVFLSIGLSAGLPVGTTGVLSNQGFSLSPRVNIGHRFSGFTLSGEISALIRTGDSTAGQLGPYGGSYWDVIGNNLFAALAATTSGDTARGELSVRFIAPLQQGWIGVEGLLGLRVNLHWAELFIAIGPGFGGHPNTPGFRLYGGASFGNSNAKPAPVCVEGQPYDLAACPDLDRDNDGIKNGVDKCPLEPEDKDGYQDSDGCPDLDNDGDGIPDTVDKCPNEAGIPEEQGCPAKDDDGDGVPNHLDNCPTVKGPAENGGCPVKEKQLVIITRERLKILEMIQFATGKATILPASNRLMNQIAGVLKTQARIKLVQIEGHTDNVGDPAKNMKLSQDRADSVKAWLVKKGVTADRFKSVGFGQDRPVESNSTAKGRELNRRVEFNILEQD